jgi:hypothetical protein
MSRIIVVVVGQFGLNTGLAGCIMKSRIIDSFVGQFFIFHTILAGSM